MDYFTIRDYKKASDDFASAIDIAPDFFLARLMHAVCAERILKSEIIADETSCPSIDSSTALNKLNKILEEYNTIVTLSPASPYPLYNRGNIYVALGRYDDAMKDYDTAIKLHPDFAEALYNRGFLNHMLDNDKQAENDLSKAGELGVAKAYQLLKTLREKKAE